MENEREKICGDCAFFMQHYAKSTGRIIEVCCGHCSYHKSKMLKRDVNKHSSACEFWESIANAKEERKEAIKETLTCMARHVNEILFILKDDDLTSP